MANLIAEIMTSDFLLHIFLLCIDRKLKKGPSVLLNLEFIQFKPQVKISVVVLLTIIVIIRPMDPAGFS